MESADDRHKKAKDILWTGAAAGIVLTLIFCATPVTENNQGFDSDGASYGVMAGSPLFPDWLGHIAPFCYRVLTPYLASRLPWGLLDNFRALAFVSNLFSLALMFLILRRLGFSRVLSALGTIFYGGVFWTVRFSFYSPACIDYQTQFFLLTIIFLGGRLAPVGSFPDYLARFTPKHAGRDFRPFFRPDAALCAAAFVFTVQCLIEEWHFRSKIGFTRRAP